MLEIYMQKDAKIQLFISPKLFMMTDIRLYVLSQ